MAAVWPIATSRGAWVKAYFALVTLPWVTVITGRKVPWHEYDRNWTSTIFDPIKALKYALRDLGVLAFSQIQSHNLLHVDPYSPTVSFAICTHKMKLIMHYYVHVELLYRSTDIPFSISLSVSPNLEPSLVNAFFDTSVFTGPGHTFVTLTLVLAS